MNFPHLPQNQHRRELRYPLHLPVVIRTEKHEVRARSENISLGGILLSSASLLAEGSIVEVAVGVNQVSDTGVLLSARGRVLRVQETAAGEFTVAIKMDRSFQLPHRSREASRPAKAGEATVLRVDALTPDMLAWHMET